jgi:hypothetical protein
VKYSLPGRVDVGGQVTAKDIIIATGSVPFVPPGEATRVGGGEAGGWVETGRGPRAGLHVQPQQQQGSGRA